MLARANRRIFLVLPQAPQENNPGQAIQKCKLTNEDVDMWRRGVPKTEPSVTTTEIGDAADDQSRHRWVL